MRKTKIVCTLGPATDEGNVLEQLIQEGMDVARFNFSHGTHEEQKARLDRLKELRTKYDRPIAAMLDTKGPEIRIGCFKEGEAVLEEGQIFTLVSRNVEGTRDYVSITYKELYKDVSPGDTILIDDGLIEMEVKEISGEDIACLVRNGGRLSDQKGVNIPGTELNMEFLSKKDRAEDPDITNAISHATCMTAMDLKANIILAASETGFTARMISKYRPGCMIGGCSSSRKVCRQLNMSWGIYPLYTKEEYSSEILCLRAMEAAKRHGLVEDGDKIVFTGGVPLGIPGKTNLIRVCIVGE